MQNMRKVVKVFIASPGDVNTERGIARDLVDEINSLHAEYTGYQIDLVGWEETVGSLGRPQEIINKDLARCELFIGILWKRWGTPPDNGGAYTSGFEEEFSLSIDRYTREGKPQMSMLFKAVDEELLRDPGTDLKKVIDFSGKLISEKKILFEKFTNEKDFERKLRRRLVTYIYDLVDNTKNIEKDDQSSVVSQDKKEREIKTHENSYLSEASLDFLGHIKDKLKTEGVNETTAADTAYMRLLANILKKSGNDNECLGAHDANLVYLYKDNYSFGGSEFIGLAMAGFEKFNSHNVPLWIWLKNSNIPIEAFTFFISKEWRHKVIDAMKLLCHKIGKVRDIYLEDWFSEKSPSQVKVSALKYLSENGLSNDLSVIMKEYEKKDILTNNEAIDAIINIKIRDSISSGFHALLELQPVVIGEKIVRKIKGNIKIISNEELVEGLSHKNGRIRMLCLEEVLSRQIVNDDFLITLLEHEDYDIRAECLINLSRKSFYLYKAKSKEILIYKDKDGKENKSLHDVYTKLTLYLEDKKYLEAKASESFNFNVDALLALAVKDKKKYTPKVRGILNDNCEEHFKSIVSAIPNKNEALIDALNKIGDNVRSNIVSQCAEWLLQHMDDSDLIILRRLLSDNCISLTPVVLSYLSRFGEWEDIKLICCPNEDLNGNKKLLGGLSNKVSILAAQTILKLARGRENELLTFSINENILAIIVAGFNKTAFMSISDENIKKLLGHENSAIREKTSQKVVQFSSRSKIETIMADVLSTHQYFYNVVHWLDLGLSMKKEISQRATRLVLEDFIEMK
ncbi:DUF4062 domain-containing protein [Erwinia sp. PsM31]|uniref:DUF4062 domain-containing protein n=1 Tax=Erwinia sp. PsM31 TaxID=3030535 RepID=UPI00263B3CE7|nr:DUF4062 domain-containing protein [Erwinia sp. PsM31]MDN4626571.1 DUF4062 domain-containing protein [Erwinia sp. PsM31]